MKLAKEIVEELREGRAKHLFNTGMEEEAIISAKLEPVVDALRDLKFLAAECQWPLRSDERGIAHGKIVDALALLDTSDPLSTDDGA